MPALRGGRLQLRDRAVVVENDHASMSTTRRLRLVALLLAVAALAAGCAAEGRSAADLPPRGRPRAQRQCARRGLAPRGQGPSAQDRLQPRPVRRRLGEPRRLRHARPDPRARPARQELSQRDAPVRGAERAARRSVHLDHDRVRPRRRLRGRHRSRRRPRRRVAEGRLALAVRRARGLRQRSAEPARRRRVGQPPEGRRRHGDVAAGQQELPLRLRRAPGLGQAQVRALGHGRRARRDAPRAGQVPDPARDLRRGASRTSDGRRARR